MSAPMKLPLSSLCQDFMEFQSVLKERRKADDKIINLLNTTIPTMSFSKNVDIGDRCRQLRAQMIEGHKSRVDSIRACIEYSSKNVEALRLQKEQSSDDVTILKELRKQQTQLRLLQSELNVEEVVQDTTNKVLYERCREYYHSSV